MVKYIKRTDTPDKLSKYYNQDNVFKKCGYGMFQNNGNCTCYAWGRWYELLGTKPKLCTRNAENWYGYTKDGYERGSTPRLGAVIVWAKGETGNGSDGAGHVAIVEEIYSDGSILTSNSAWKSQLFYTKKYEKGYKLPGYRFLGFIYPPVAYEQESKSYRYAVGATYKTQVALKVRESAGIDKPWKLRSELTKDGLKHSYPQPYAVLKPGTEVTCLEIQNIAHDIWLRIPSGWVAGFYKGEVYIK